MDAARDIIWSTCYVKNSVCIQLVCVEQAGHKCGCIIHTSNSSTRLWQNLIEITLTPTNDKQLYHATVLTIAACVRAPKQIMMVPVFQHRQHQWMVIVFYTKPYRSLVDSVIELFLSCVFPHCVSMSDINQTIPSPSHEWADINTRAETAAFGVLLNSGGMNWWWVA